MSKYRIYRANVSDPKQTGKKNKWLFSAYIVLIFLLFQIPNYTQLLNHKKFSWVGYILFYGIIIIIIVLIFRKLRHMSNSLEKIGIIELTRNNIKKEIGDLKTIYKYDEILKIELEVYIRDVTISWNKTSTLTHLLKITHMDFTADNLIVSDKSIDFKQKISIGDSLKTLKAIKGLNILIKRTDVKKHKGYCCWR